MSLQRIRLASTAPELRLSSRRALVSLAWWEPGDPEPVLVRGPHGGPSTVVIVWPSDERGLFAREAMDRHEYRVVPWHLDDGSVDRLRQLVDRGWALERHDLWVTRDRLVPRPHTMRDWPELRVAQAVAGVVEALRRAAS